MTSPRSHSRPNRDHLRHSHYREGVIVIPFQCKVYKISVCLYLKKTNMASTACFMIVSRNDIPIYEAEVGAAVKKEEAAHQHQFILHAALDIVQDLAWTTSAMFLKAVDRFNDLVVSVYVTAGLHDSRNDDGIKSFFQEVHELYVKIFFLIHFIYLDLGLHHLALIRKFEPLQGNISDPFVHHRPEFGREV
ncbi:unnamed protein product [Camellia sinensis]